MKKFSKHEHMAAVNFSSEFSKDVPMYGIHNTNLSTIRTFCCICMNGLAILMNNPYQFIFTLLFKKPIDCRNEWQWIK